jgi:hypothetical protein
MIKNMPDSTNGKVSIKQLYDEIIPMIEDIASMKTDMSNIKNDVRDIKECNKNFISRPAFIGWLGAMATVLSIAIILLGFIK